MDKQDPEANRVASVTAPSFTQPFTGLVTTRNSSEILYVAVRMACREIGCLLCNCVFVGRNASHMLTGQVKHPLLLIAHPLRMHYLSLGSGRHQPGLRHGKKGNQADSEG